ncbi:hypothetical protein FC07_GL001333 [Loigolactobacillus bifermentans DSM 20003]|uniref:Transposase n=1 Tax=Loigolactobacillus bifermentans DSM 20003 TaxID=1423726 RepID=A0A0R1H847_9LACO|nr:hypothetical protein FC07_GL001333 [Loigolactobacillus bifermentans DSM 20003]
MAKTLKNGRKKRTVTLTVSDMDYHFGVKRVMFPSSAQKQIIKQNSDAFRFIYNRLVATTRDIWSYQKLIEKCRKQYEHSHNDWFLNQISVLETEIPLLRQQIYNVTSIKNQYKWLCKNKNLDSLMFFKAKSAYQAAWNMFRKVHHAGIPKFHKKSYDLRYQTAYLKHNIELLDRTHVKLPKIGRIRIKQLPN